MSSEDLAQHILARIRSQTTQAQDRPAQVHHGSQDVLSTTGRVAAAAGRVVAGVDLQGVLTGLAVSDVVAQGEGSAHRFARSASVSDTDFGDSVQCGGPGRG